MKAHFKTISLNKNYTPDKFKIRIRISHNKQQLVILDLDKGPKFSRIWMKAFSNGGTQFIIKEDVSCRVIPLIWSWSETDTYSVHNTLHSPSKCLAWVKKCHHVWLDQNFDLSLLTNKLWHVFMGMKHFFYIKMAD